jgi:hypothetical protein
MIIVRVEDRNNTAERDGPEIMRGHRIMRYIGRIGN